MPNPSGIFDLALWKVTLPVGGKNRPTELAGTDLVAYSSDWMKLLPAGGMQFRAPVDGGTTSGSGYPRSELRELNLDGSLASWSSSDGKTHTMVVDEAVTRIPNPRTSGNSAVVSAQIHDGSNDISVFRVEDGKVWVTQGDTTHFALADADYVPGARFKAMFVVTSGTLSAFYNGAKVCSFPVTGSGWYFKAGAYVQANASNSSPDDATNYGENVLYSVTVAHGAPLPGSDPVPAPVPVPDPTPTPDPTPVPVPTGAGPIFVIRHGEKPSDSNDHTLAPKGVLRANALPPLFTVPRADLARPTWIFASKGASDSMRMVQTAQPTADALHLTMDTRYDVETAVKDTATLLVKQAKAGLVVLAVLEHSAIPAVLKEIAKQLGTKDKVPTSHADDDFHTGYRFFGPSFAIWQESVLPGDPGFVAAPAPVTPPVTDPPPVVTPPVVTVPPPVDVPPVVAPPVEPPVVVPDPPVEQPPAEPTRDPAPKPSVPDWWTAFIEWIRKVFG